jgi:hypothetical protein
MAGSSSVRAGFVQGRALYPGTFGAIRIRHIERCLEIVSLVIHRRVVAKVLATHTHLVGPTGNADGTAPLDLGDLADA